MIYTPHRYQSYATKRILEQSSLGLFLGMGLGKTVITLTAISELLFNYFAVSRVLVIAPLRVAEDTWSREADKWEHLKHLKIAKMLGSEKQRLAALRSNADVYIINRENVEWLVDMCKKDWPFDMVVIDELSSFKSSKARRFRALRKVRPLIKRIVGLTGTPAPNGLLDLWPQVYLLDGGERLGKTVTGYRDRYFLPDKRSQQTIFSWKPREEAERAVYAKLADICISMTAEDYLEIPERVDIIHPVKLSAKARENYARLEKEMVLEYAGEEITAVNAAVLAGKLLQLANGAIYNADCKVVNVHDEKLLALDDLLEAANGRPVIVFYAFKHDAERIRTHLAKRYEVGTLEGAEDIAQWNEGKTGVLLLHPASAGHGLNLQDGGNIIIWFGLSWSLELYQQANARLHRQGQQQKVLVHHIIAEGTMDEQVMLVLEGKAEKQGMLLEAVKARIDNVRGGH